MRTPRPNTTTRRGFGTLIGNGWLHESPKNVWPKGWDLRGRSALRKCMFIPVPQALRDLGPPQGPVQGRVSPAAMPKIPAMMVPPHAPVRRDPAKDARIFPAISPNDVFAAKKRALYAEEKAKLLGKAVAPGAWYEDPIALGSLLIIFPPIGLAALWSSKRYSSDARWALTIMTALTLCLGAAITIAIITLRA